MEKKD